MSNKYKITLSLFLLVFVFIKTNAQQIGYDLSYRGFLDNREYARSNRFSQTIFGFRVAPTIILKVDSVNSFHGGINVLKEFGSLKTAEKINLTAYYQFNKKPYQLFIGAFPRYGLIDDYPLVALRDTFNYYRPNIEGMLASYQKNGLSQTLWIDWTSRQTNVERETFLFGLKGLYQKDIFQLKNYIYMFHNAGPGVPIPDDHVGDNGAALITVGVAKNKVWFLDSLSLHVGGIMSFERIRSVTGWNTPAGVITELFAKYKSFSIKDTFYAGEGHHLINGDSFYTAKQYNRLDLSWKPINYKNISGEFIFSYHFLEGKVDNQQAFKLSYNFGRLYRVKI